MIDMEVIQKIIHYT